MKLGLIIAIATVIGLWITYRYYLTSDSNFSLFGPAIPNSSGGTTATPLTTSNVMPASWNPGGGFNPGYVRGQVYGPSNPSGVNG